MAFAAAQTKAPLGSQARLSSVRPLATKNVSVRLQIRCCALFFPFVRCNFTHFSKVFSLPVLSISQVNRAFVSSKRSQVKTVSQAVSLQTFPSKTTRTEKPPPPRN